MKEQRDQFGLTTEGVEYFKDQDEYLEFVRSKYGEEVVERTKKVLEMESLLDND